MQTPPVRDLSIIEVTRRRPKNGPKTPPAPPRSRRPARPPGGRDVASGQLRHLRFTWVTQLSSTVTEGVGMLCRSQIVVVAAMGLVLGACSSDDPDPEAQQAGSSDEAPPADPGAGEGEWDPEEWEPTVRIEPSSFSEADREQFYQESMTRSAEQLGVSASACLRPRACEGSWNFLRIARVELLST